MFRGKQIAHIKTAGLSARRSVSMDCRVVMGKTRFALLPGDDF